MSSREQGSNPEHLSSQELEVKLNKFRSQEKNVLDEFDGKAANIARVMMLVTEKTAEEVITNEQ